MVDIKESVQDTNWRFTENQVSLIQLLMEPYVTYGFNLFLFHVGKDCSFLTDSCMTLSWSRVCCFDGEL